jgi:hypothetical protein
MPSIFSLGLAVQPKNGFRSLVLAVATGLGFGTYMALSDATVFRSVVPESQTALIAASSVLQRLGIFAQGVVVEEVLFRLIIMSAVVWLLTTIAGAPRKWCYWAAILLVAFVVYPLFHRSYLASLDFTALVVLREVVLHGAVGVLWGYLYWRYGFFAAVIGHISAHIALEPLRGLL